MKYNRFEELPVWQAAIELAVLIFDFDLSPCVQALLWLEGPA